MLLFSLLYWCFSCHVALFYVSCYCCLSVAAVAFTSLLLLLLYLFSCELLFGIAVRGLMLALLLYCCYYLLLMIFMCSSCLCYKWGCCYHNWQLPDILSSIVVTNGVVAKPFLYVLIRSLPIMSAHFACAYFVRAY